MDTLTAKSEATFATILDAAMEMAARIAMRDSRWVRSWMMFTTAFPRQ